MKTRSGLARAAVAASIMFATAGCSLNASSDGDTGPTQTNTATSPDGGKASRSGSDNSGGTQSATGDSTASHTPTGQGTASHTPRGDYQQVRAAKTGISFSVPNEWVNALDDPKLREAVARANNMTEDQLATTFDVFYQATTREDGFVANVNVNNIPLSAEIPDEEALKRLLGDIANYRTAKTAAGEVAVADLGDRNGIQCTGLFVPSSDGKYHAIFVNTKSKDKTKEIVETILATLR